MSRVRVERARARARARFASPWLASPCLASPCLASPWLASLLLAGALFAGCGNSEEAKIAALTHELGKLRQSVTETRAEVAERETTAKAAQDALAKSRGVLRDSEARIAEIEKELGTHVTDPVLFRMVQKQLLEDDDLEKVAISANVQRGVVTLSGVVNDEKLRERAVKLAESVPGVVSVQDRIQVAGGKPGAG